MKFKYHLLLGVIFAVLLYLLFSPLISLFGLLIIFLSSFLIDVDHYLYYVCKKGDFSLIRAYSWYMKNARKFCFMSKEKRKQFYLGFYIFHGIEPLIILFFLGFYISQFFTFILIGFLLHLSTDLISEIIFRQKIDKVSVIQNLLLTGKLTNLEEVEVH
jgi:hypothetical protein